MANTTQEKQTVSKLGAHVSTSHKSLHQRKEMLYFSSLLSFLVCIFLRFASLISDVWALTYTALFHWWTLTFARVKCLSCVSEMAPVFLILLAAGCWLLGQLLCHEVNMWLGDVFCGCGSASDSSSSRFSLWQWRGVLKAHPCTTSTTKMEKTNYWKAEL